jgi:hypothetical protein
MRTPYVVVFVTPKKKTFDTQGMDDEGLACPYITSKSAGLPFGAVLTTDLNDRLPIAPAILATPLSLKEHYT